MGIDASKSADRNRSSIKLRRKDFRTLLCENLERRDLMAFSAGVFVAPGTTMEYFTEWQNKFETTTGEGPGGGGGDSSPFNLQGSRWTNPVGGPSPVIGDVATVTWSIVPDGTPTDTGVASNLVGFMDGIYGGGSGPVAQRPWFNIVKRVYDNWGKNSGLTFVYEAADDGSSMTAGRGVAGVRGDVRVAGHAIDGNSGVLAYNFFPSGGGNSALDGDMIVDTTDNFYANNADGPTGENRGLVNVLTHEVGHGIGLGHVIPVDSTKLMEPFVNFAFLGAQHDDILGSHQLYGDDREKNNLAATATDLGTLGNGITRVTEASITTGADPDWFSFRVSSGGKLSLTLTPNGRQYQVGPQGGTAALVDTTRNEDLALQVSSSDGTVLATVNATGLGFAEALTDLQLPSGGQYFVRVSGTGTIVQLYDLVLSLKGVVTGTVDARAPRLLSVSPNSGEIFSFNRVNTLREAPTELVFRFDGSQLLDASSLAGIRVIRSGRDGNFANGNEQTIVPGFVGFGESDRIIILRFSSTLVDDSYRIEILGNDVPSQGLTAIRNIDGLPLNPRIAGTDRDTMFFNLELAAQVIAVVPQPIDRGVAPGPGQQSPLVQRFNDIDVYFNNDDLDPVSAIDPTFYQLVLTNDSVNPKDDQRFIPTAVVYDAVKDKAILTFGVTGVPATSEPLKQGAGTFRLRIGSKDVVASSSALPVVFSISPPADPLGTLAGASDLTGFIGTLSGPVSAQINESVVTQVVDQLNLDFPGSNDEPGHRDIQDESHIGATADANSQITKLFYNFAIGRSYGVDSNTQPLQSSINLQQMDRIREAFEFYSVHLGIDFAESDSQGFTLVVGDPFPNGVADGPGGILARTVLVPAPLTIFDGSESWNNGFGGNFFNFALREVGKLIGLGSDNELPTGTFQVTDTTLAAGGPVERMFPGNSDIVHGQYLYRPDNRDTDIYKFFVGAGQSGQLSLETVAERLRNSSDADTYLTLMKKTTAGYDVIAVNNDYFSSDSYINVNVTEGEYYVAVTSKGNENSNPLTSGTGGGGVSQGQYQLLLNFKPTNSASAIKDTSGTGLDGDGDGLAGGDFNFWFRTATPIENALPGAKSVVVDKGYAGGGSNGSLAKPFTSLPAAAAAVSSGDIIRVVGSVGVDNNLATVGDNPAYEIGRGGVGNAVLSDGVTFEVPRGVTMMIDAGAIFKMKGSRIVAGSRAAGVDNRFSSLQILGTPSQSVIFTSYNDETIGTDTNALNTTASAGDWGGLEFHNDVDRSQGRGDYERAGIFLNYIGNSDLRYGGGQITVATPSPTVSPIQMVEARPTLLNNRITFSADSAISADPNSFEETLFTEPRYQLAGAFGPDYERVGPDIRGNTLLNNSVNGLFVRIPTLAGGELQTLDVQGRFDDTDITHVFGENLIIRGTPGGSLVETVAPNVSLVQTFPATGGTLSAVSSFSYKIVFVDRFGGESIPSASTPLTIVGAGGALLLQNLPTAPVQFVGRQLWRSSTGGAGPWTLVSELDGDSTTVTDIGKDLSVTRATLAEVTLQRNRADARLKIDPGIVAKLQGVRIEVGVSAQLIAEGTPDKPVILTSRFDDRYGAGGTFDTSNDGAGRLPQAGDWGGLVARHLSSLSIDSALITFGGGVVTVPGGAASFNAVEIQEADARIANSVFESNASGFSGNAAVRGELGPNDRATIFVTSSQPVLINNVIRRNFQVDSAAISIDANSMKSVSAQDSGRHTGINNRMPGAIGNMGPLIRGNRLAENGLNGMRIRGGILTIDSVWDDTDIVHVLQSEVVVPDFHTYGGLRLQSKVGESLVVKLGSNAGLTAAGKPLDIPDRIGGSLQIIGSPGFPVVLTSLTDDTVGAGFDPTGRPQVDTDGLGSTSGTAGSWRSVRLNAYSNDRNLDTTYELEADQVQDKGVNDEPGNAQPLGGLAATADQGDESLRLGYTLYGSIAAPTDLDVYSFTATAGTPIWIDIDQTASSLDSVVELIDSFGIVIARSDNSLAESLAGTVNFMDATTTAANAVQVLDRDPFAPRNSRQATTARDLYSVNPLDAGFRVVLPGAIGTPNTNYFLRVRSSAGITTGSYRLQVRMQQTDEIAGSTVRYADIRFATTGVEALGLPGHSPLLGESSELLPDTSAPATATPLGNIANSDRAGFSVAGALGIPLDTDWYSFSVGRDATEVGNTHLAVSFDIDYADGLGRANTSLWVYRVNGGVMRLVLVGTDSNIADDRAAPGQSPDWDDLSRGSLGSRDAFIGLQELLPGNYVVAVSNNSVISSQLEQFQIANPSNPLARLEPLDSIQRISVDRFEGANFTETAVGPKQVSFSGVANAVPWTLADVTTFTVQDNGNGSRILFTNTFTGAQEAQVSTANRVNDVAMAPDGRLVAYTITNPAAQTDANSGNFTILDSAGDGAEASAGNSGIQTFTTEVVGTALAITPRQFNGAANGDGIQFNGLTFWSQTTTSALQLFGVGSRGNGQLSFNQAVLDANNAVVGSIPATGRGTNVVYRLDPTTGAAINPAGVPDRTGTNLTTGAGTNKVEFGRFQSSGTGAAGNGQVTGIADIGTTLVAVSDIGELFVVNIGAGTNAFGTVGPITTVLNPTTGTGIAFQGLTMGPRNLEGGSFVNTLFGIESNGTVWAFNSAGTLLPVFPGGAVSVKSTSAAFTGVKGFDFSPLDVNLWHLTNTQGGTAGHGRPATFDGSRTGNQTGANSLYFGFENPAGNSQPGVWNGIYDVAAYRNTFNLPGGALGAVESNPIDLRGYGINDLPTLYFSYNLSTENRNSPSNDGDVRMRDAFRVYAAGENGRWVLVATNNSSHSGNFADGNDEFDLVNYTDANGKPYSVQELFDNGDAGAPASWRQARISLAPFAGQQNVKIRYEFSSGASFRSGDVLRGGETLTAVEGWKIADATNFQIISADVAVPVTTTFEFDQGLVFDLPGGASIDDGDTVTVNGRVFTFSLTDGTGDNILFTKANTPAEIAQLVFTELDGAPFSGIYLNPVRPNSLSILTDGNVPKNGFYNAAAPITAVTNATSVVLTFAVGAASNNLTIDLNNEIFTLSFASNLGNNIQITAADTAIQVATKVQAKLAARNYKNLTRVNQVLTFGFTDGNLPVAGAYAVGGLPASVITGRPGVVVGNVSVPVHQAMSLFQVRNAVRAGLARGLNVTTPTDQTRNLSVWPVSGDTIRLYRYNALSSGPLGLTTTRTGDFFGVDPRNSAADRQDERAQVNTGFGVFIDDIVIGLAERGEMVNDGADEANPSIVTNRDYELPGYLINEIETGAYQLEIRTAADYGTSSGNRLVLGNPFLPSRSFDSNARLTQQVSIQVNTSGNIPDGFTFTLSDGIGQLTFEFDVTNGATDSAVGTVAGNIPVRVNANDSTIQIAQKIRDAINSLAVQGSASVPALLKVSAALRGEMPNGTGGTIIDLHGPAALSRTGGLTFSGTALSIIRSGDETAFGEDVGDSNRLRDQGQVVISSSTVTSSSGFGILVDAAARNQTIVAPAVGDRPYPGSPRNLPTLNTANFAPGIVVVNNILSSNAAGGLRISGDLRAGSDSTITSTIARVINNTIYGVRSGDTGILVEQGAAPTLLNNILSNAAVGVSVDAVSTSTVLGANLFQGNGNNTVGTTVGANAIVLLTTNPAIDPLFIDATSGRFYLLPGSQAIDSSQQVFFEQPLLTQVKNSISLPLSPMIAPDRDVTGQRRVDDPSVNTPSGLGSNVFIDRGAVDRADFLGLEAVLLRPLDNDSSNVDVDRNPTYVRLTNGSLDYFSILLSEIEGTGPYLPTVSQESVILTENGRLLLPGVDYIFGYNGNSRTIRLTPLAGIWRRDSTYEITLNNRDSIRIDTVAGNLIKDGDQVVTQLGGGASATFEYDSGFVAKIPQTLTLQTPATGSGPSGILDGQRFTISNGALVATFEFDTNSNTIAGNRPIVIPPIGTATQVRDAILAALLLPANADLNLAPKALGLDRIHLGTLAQHAASTFGSLLSLSGVSAGIADGQSFSYKVSGKAAVVFEFNETATPIGIVGATTISFLRTDTNLEIADKVVAALAGVVPASFAPVSHLGAGLVHVGGAVGDLMNVGNPTPTTVMTVSGSPGVTDSFVLRMPATGGLGITDGQLFRISVGATVVTFEFTKDLSTSPGNIAISVSDTDTADVLAARVAAAIGSAGLGISPTSAPGGLVRLNEPRTTVVNLLTSPLVLTGIAGKAVAVPFVPSSSFTRYQVAVQLSAAMRRAGVGLQTVMAGDGGVLVTGATQITGATTVSIGAIKDIAGNRLVPNRVNSLTQFTILMPEVGVDYGDTKPGASNNTLQANNGVRHAIYPVDIPLLALGQFVDADGDGQPSVAADGDDFGSSFAFSAGLPMSIGSRGPTRLNFVSAPTAAVLGRKITISDTVNRSVTYQFIDSTNTPPLVVGNVAVDLTGVTTAAGAASSLATAIRNSILAGRITGIHSILDGANVSIGGTSGHNVDLSNLAGITFLQKQASGSVDLVIPAVLTGLAQGQTFTIQDGSGNTVTFQIINTTAPVALILGNIPIVIDTATATQSSFTTAVGEAIKSAVIAGRLRLTKGALRDPDLAYDATKGIITVNADDEDGVRFNGLFNASMIPAVSVVVSATGSGFLDAWFDWNQDSDFDDLGEQVLISQPVVAGGNTFLVSTPVSAAIGYTIARFRLSATGGLFTYGLAVGGEVEDHIIEVLAGTPPVAVNDPDPTKLAQYRVNEDLVLTVSTADGVLFNDTDVDTPAVDRRVFDEDPFLAGVQPVTTTQNGTLVLNLDGSFVYTPNANFFGTDTFSYRLTDPRLVSNNIATVTITVNPVNDVPFANPDTITISEDNVQTWAGALFTGNDIQGITLPLPGVAIANEANATAGFPAQKLIVKTVNLVAAARSGESVSVTNNVITYTPGTNYNERINGPVLIRLEVEDDGVTGFPAVNDFKSAFSTLTVNITAVNDSPLFNLAEVVATVAPNAFTNTPTVNANSEEITVTANEDAPTQKLRIFKNIAAGPVLADDELGTGLFPADKQPTDFIVTIRPQDTYLFTAAGLPKVNQIGGGLGELEFTLAPDANSLALGPAIVTFQIDDKGGPGAAPNGPTGNLSKIYTATINVRPVNDAPILIDDVKTFNEDFVQSWNQTDFLANDLPGPSNENLQTLTIVNAELVDPLNPTNVIPPRSGESIAVTTAGPNTLVNYNPGTNYNLRIGGTVFVRLSVQDSLNLNDQGTVQTRTSILRITINPVNDSPLFSLAAVAPTVAPNAFTNAPTVNPTGEEITVTVNEDAPTQKMRIFSGIAAGPVLADDELGNGLFAADKQPTDFIVTIRPQDTYLFTATGLPKVNQIGGGIGELEYTLAADANSLALGPAIVTFQIDDKSGAASAPNGPTGNLSKIHTVTINVRPVNDAPILLDDAKTFNEDIAQSWNQTDFLVGDVTGPANENLQTLKIVNAVLVNSANVVIAARPGESVSVTTVGPNTFVNYTPGTNYNRLIASTVFVRLSVQDTLDTNDQGTVQTVSSLLAITIDPVNDSPLFDLVAVPPTTTVPTTNPTTGSMSLALTVEEDAATQKLAIFSGIAAGPVLADDELGNVVGLPAQPTNFIITVRPQDRFLFTAAGQPKVNVLAGGKGELEFTLAPDANTILGPVVVTFQINDNGGAGAAPNGPTGPLSKTHTVTINVNPVNDAPQFTISTNTFSTVEDTPLTRIPGFLTGIVPGPATAIDEVGQTVTITVAPADAINGVSYFKVQPRITGTGDLEFQLNDDVNSRFSGSLNIAVTATDNGTPLIASTTKILTITAADINDSPSFTLNKSVIAVREDEETFAPVTTQTVITDFVRNLRRGPDTARDERGFEQDAAQTLAFETIVNSNPTLFTAAGQPTIDTTTGNLVFHTAPDRSGTSVFVVRLTDTGRVGPPPNSNVSATATFTINIRSVNDAPEFSLPASRQTTADEDQGVVTVPGFAIGIRPGPATAIDESTQELNFIVRAENPSVFAVQPTIQADGTLVYQTARDVNDNTRDTNGALLSRRVFVSLRDNGPSTSPDINLSAEQTFTVNINPINDPPITSAHVVLGAEETRMTITAASIIAGLSPDAPGPLDEVVAGQRVRMTQIERTTDRGGVVTPIFVADQIISFEYSPPLNYVGDDIIRYVVTDDGVPQASATGTITIQLSPINDPPQFIAGSDITVQEDASAFSAAWATAILAGPPSALDEINGVPPNTPAQTVSFVLTTNNDSLFSVLPAVSPTGVLTFTLAKDANGRAIVDVVAVDSGSGTLPNNNRSAVSKLTIVANPLNDAPGFNVIGNVSVEEDSARYTAPAIKDIVPAQGLNDTPATGADEVGQSVSIFTSNNNNSLFSVQPTISATGILEFVPAQDAFGTAIVSVFARDNGANTPPNVNQSAAKTFTITLQQKNDAPVAVNDRYTTGEDTVLTVNAPGVISNDRDVDLPNDTITVSSSQTSSTLGAIVSVLPNGQFTYDSRNAAQLQRLVDGETALDTFTYTLRDFIGLTSNLATVTITVSGSNDTPVAVNDNLSVPFGITELLNVLANDKDVDNSIDPRTVEIGQLASHGTATAQPTGRIEYRPAPGFRGIDTFTYRVRDSLGALSNEALVTVTVNTSPLAVADFARTNIGTPVVIDVLRNDSDPDGTLNRGSVTIASGPDVGSAAVQADGSIRYSPAAGFGGTATLQYSVQDNDGLSSNLATVTIIVGGSIHQNPSNNLDVNADGSISPIDVLILVNDINFNGARVLPSTLPTPPYLDPNGNGSIDPLDILLIINYINDRGNAGAGEGEVSMADLGYSQELAQMPSTELMVFSIQKYEPRTETHVDLAVSSIILDEPMYGPSLSNSSEIDGSNDSLESYLAGWVTKTKRSESSLDSIFADEGWM